MFAHWSGGKAGRIGGNGGCAGLGWRTLRKRTAASVHIYISRSGGTELIIGLLGVSSSTYVLVKPALFLKRADYGCKILHSYSKFYIPVLPLIYSTLPPPFARDPRRKGGRPLISPEDFNKAESEAASRNTHVSRPPQEPNEKPKTNCGEKFIGQQVGSVGSVCPSINDRRPMTDRSERLIVCALNRTGVYGRSKARCRSFGLRRWIICRMLNARRPHSVHCD